MFDVLQLQLISSIKRSNEKAAESVEESSAFNRRSPSFQFRLKFPDLNASYLERRLFISSAFKERAPRL